MQLTHRQVEAFRAVVQTGTTVGAALLLHTSQPSISRLLRELEAAVRLKLFDRVKGRLLVTAEGVAFHEEVRRSFAGLQRLSEVAAGLVQFSGRELRVGALPALGLVLIPRLVARFHRRYPGVRVVLGVAESTTIRDWVTYHQVALGYVEGGVEPLECDAYRLLTVPGVVVMPRGHPLARLRVVQAADLHRAPYVHLWRGNSERRQIEAVLDQAGVSVATKAETHYALGACALVAEGIGVAVVNPLVLLGAAKFDVEVRPFRPAIKLAILELSRRGAPPDALLKEFVAMARSELATIARATARAGGIAPRGQ